MLGPKDEEREGSSGNGRRAYLRSVSWTDRSPNKPSPLYPKPQPSSKARSCLPPLQPLSITRRNVEEWPKAGSDDLGVWPQPTTPGGRRIGCGGLSEPTTPGGQRIGCGSSGLKLNENLKIEVPVREFESNKDRLAFFERECSRIKDHIYLGSEMVAKSREVLRQNGITHVLNCVGFICPEHFKGDLVYKTLWLQDSPSEDITSILYDVFDYFEDVKEQGGRVLVHCSQGVSRSTSLVIAYLMWKEGKSFEDAFQFVKGARGVTNPNMGFACQLLQCQKRVHAVPASPNSLLRMYRMAPHSPYDPLHLVPKLLGHPGKQCLDSRGAFVIHVPSAIYVWTGKFCSCVMFNNAMVVAQQVKRYEKAQGPILTIKECEEPSEFWELLSKEELSKKEVLKQRSDRFMSDGNDVCMTSYDAEDKKVDDYDLDFEIFHKALAGGVVPASTSPGSPSETRLPARENGWGRLRRKFSTGIMKEFLSSPEVAFQNAHTNHEPEQSDFLHDADEPLSPIAHLLHSSSNKTLPESGLPNAVGVCERFEQFARHADSSVSFPSPCSSPDSFSPCARNSLTFNYKSPSLSPSASDYSSPFSFSPSSSNWSDLSNLSSQPSPSGLELYDRLCSRHPMSTEIDCKSPKENSESGMDAFADIKSWKASALCSPCKGISPSLAERRGSSPPTLMLQPTAEAPYVPRTVVKSWSFSLPESGDETVNNFWGHGAKT